MKTRPLPHFSRRQWSGFACIYIAGLSWLADIIIPFTHLSNKPMLFAIALAFAEIMFFTGVALLGKTAYLQAKAALTSSLLGAGHAKPRDDSEDRIGRNRQPK
jgi:hypothetical protein